ncbi:uncharacterized protein LOC125945061 [Dermacentor silvarum]|uniref:uncharacterized protein LOC125945061 n=1 Tax=Dermacentor silvarum TaxID=543639 RepID=UPI0021007E72|nr:uncharacterized protein LOC125945061 [Dermacentor silvarum]
MKARIEDRIVYSPHPHIDIPLCSFYALAKEKLLINPNKMALVSDLLSLTRAEVLAGMQRYAIGFRQNGMLPGDNVCIHLNNSVENLIAIYGCILAGATVFLASSLLTENELRYEAEDCDCRHVVTDEPNALKVSSAVARLNVKGRFCVGQAAGFVSTSEFLKIDEREFRECPVTDPKETVLAVCYTSGSTGLPKGAEVTHYSYVACFYTTRIHVPWGEPDILLGLNPITHQAGMLYSMIAVLDGATCAVVPTNLTPLEIMDAVDKYKVTAAQMFPGRLQALVREMRRTGRTLPSMRGIAAGGSVLSTQAAEQARKAFGGLELLVHVYGMTESCCCVTSQPKNKELSVTADVGFPDTNVAVKVVDVLTREKLGPRQTGEVCYRADSMMRGYYKRPKETADLIDEDGWCKSGDAGYYDEDGRFYIVDRLKQMIKCLDNPVVPAELEEHLLREYASDIAEVSIVGLPHCHYGEAPAAAVVLTDEGRRKDSEELAENIKATVASSHALHKQLYGGVFFMDSLPKTDTGKVSRPNLVRCLVRA